MSKYWRLASENPSEYNSWRGMKARCYRENDVHYKYYGGKGIKVCERWLVFAGFFADMGPKPTSDYTIDRLDNDRDYEPGNCQWLHKSEQNNNRGLVQSKYSFEFKGETRSLSGWAKKMGMSTSRVKTRLKAGWSIEKALLTDPSQEITDLEFDGQAMSLEDWGAKVGIKPATIRGRLRAGWSMDKALSHDPKIHIGTPCSEASKAKLRDAQHNAKPLTAWGETKHRSEWAQDARCQVSLGTLCARIQHGWPAEKAISDGYGRKTKSHEVNIKQQRIFITAWGETKGLEEWTQDERCVLGRYGIQKRLAAGWSPEEAISRQAYH